MKENWRYPAITITHPITEEGKPSEINCRIDLKPDTEKAHGVMIWRTNGQGKGHQIDVALDKISRKISRVMQGRAP